MKKQNKVLLAAALAVSVMGGFAVQAEEKLPPIDRQDFVTTGNHLQDIAKDYLLDGLKSDELKKREAELEKIQKNYDAKKDKYGIGSEAEQAAKWQLKWKQRVIDEMKDKEEDALTKKLWGERPEVTNETVKAQKKLVAEQKKLVEDTTKEVNSRQKEVDKLKANLDKYKNNPDAKKNAEHVIQWKSRILLEQKIKLTRATAELKKREDELKSQEAVIKNASDAFKKLDDIYAKPETLPETGDFTIHNNLGDLILKHDGEAEHPFLTPEQRQKLIPDLIQNNAAQIQENKKAVDNNKQAIEKNAGDIATNKQAIEKNAGNIATNKQAIEKNAGNISSLDKRLAAADVALGGRIDQLATDTDKGLAKASALAALHPLDFDPSSKLNFAVAGGFYNGENAVALGAFYRPNRNVLLSFGSSIAGGENAYNVGLSVKVGKGGDRINQENTTISELYDLVGRLQDQVAAQQKKIEELQAK